MKERVVTAFLAVAWTAFMAGAALVLWATGEGPYGHQDRR